MTGSGSTTGRVALARISAEPLELGAHLDAVQDVTAGAETTFVGRVRDHDPEAAGEVIALEYTAHPDAERTLVELAERTAQRTGAIVAVSHRIGRLEVGDAAVVIATAAAHRAMAFDACRTIIEDIKLELAVWKRQIEADGSAEWKGLGG